MTTALMVRALYGEPKPGSARGQALWLCRNLRATRSWLTPYSYGWLRYTADLKHAQRQILALRKA